MSRELAATVVRYLGATCPCSSPHVSTRARLLYSAFLHMSPHFRTHLYHKRLHICCVVWPIYSYGLHRRQDNLLCAMLMHLSAQTSAQTCTLTFFRTHECSNRCTCCMRVGCTHALLSTFFKCKSVSPAMPTHVYTHFYAHASMPMHSLHTHRQMRLYACCT